MQADGSSEGMEEAGEPQYSALPGHMRRRAAQQAVQDEQPRTSAEFTTKNLERLPAFSDHSFEVRSDHMSFTDPASSSELEEGDEDRKAAEDSRVAFLKSLNIREQALHRAQRIGLEEAIVEVKAERGEYLASLGKSERERGSRKSMGFR